jgi:hypothetical protein
LRNLGWLLVVALFASLGVVSGAAASSENRIAVVGLAQDNALTRQLNAELRTLEFQVILSDEPIGSWRELRELARRLKVAAAVWITGIDQPTMEIWVVDLVTGKTVQRSIEREAGRSGSSSRVLAMRVIELLRASFREIAASPEPPQESEVKPSSAVRAMAVARETGSEKQANVARTRKPSPEATTRLSVILGPGIELSIGGIAPSFQVCIGLHWRFSSPWGIATYLRASTVGVTVAGDNGSAKVFVSGIGVGPYYLLAAPTSRWQPDIGVGIAWVAAYMKGKAVEPAEGKSALATSPALFARAGLVVHAVGAVGVRLDVEAGSVLPPVVVRFAGHDQATWGQLYGGATLALEVAL